MTPVRTTLNLFAFVAFVALWAGLAYAFVVASGSFAGGW